MSLQQPDLDRLTLAAHERLHEHWQSFLTEGIVLVVLGIIAMVAPQIASLAITILVGWLFLVSGILGLVMTFWMRRAPGFWWSILSALIGIAAGVTLLMWPISGVITLTLVLITFFIVEGVASIMFAMDHNRGASGRWGWMLASGLIDLVLAVMIFAGLPDTAAWAIGLLVGINMTFGGVALIVMALHARGATPGPLATSPR